MVVYLQGRLFNRNTWQRLRLLLQTAYCSQCHLCTNSNMLSDHFLELRAAEGRNGWGFMCTHYRCVVGLSCFYSSSRLQYVKQKIIICNYQSADPCLVLWFYQSKTDSVFTNPHPLTAPAFFSAVTFLRLRPVLLYVHLTPPKHRVKDNPALLK